jgi:hypothetical protein
VKPMPAEQDALYLEHWAIIQREGFPGPSVFGYIHGHHPRRNPVTGLFDVGHRIVTSEIADAHGKLVRTASGTRYELGTPHPLWREAVGKGGAVYMAQTPITTAQLACAVTEEEANEWRRI